MKRCYHAVSWEFKAGFVLAGLSLGFDRRSEHVEGISPLLVKLGVAVPDFPVGLAERQLTVGPPALRFSTYDLQPSDKRRRGYPAALLCLLDPGSADVGSDARTLSNGELVSRYDLGFVSEPVQKAHDLTHDLVAAWGAGGFAVHVRGPRNIFLLGQLHEAILARNVAVMAPIPGAREGEVRLILASMITEQDKVQLVEADKASRELQRAVADTGVLAQLSHAGCLYQSLTPEWFDESHDEIIFFLEPTTFSQVNGGWFSLAELQAWATGTGGPVVWDAALDRLAGEARYENWESRLVRGLARIGAVSRCCAHLVWLAQPGRVPGFSYRATRETEQIFPSGIYPFHAVMAQHAISLEEDQRAPAAVRAARSA